MRAVAPVSLLALALALLAGCGGDGDAAGTSAGGGEAAGTGAEEPVRTQSAERARAAQRARAARRAHAERRRHSSGNGGSGAEPAGPAPTPSGPLPNEGTKGAAPGVPTVKGGDNSIQRFGVESPSSDRVAAARALKTYLDARAAGDWARACMGVSAGLNAEFRQFGRQSAQGGKLPSCAETMRTLTAGVPASALRTAAAIHVLSMRLEGSTAFLLYKNGDGTPSEIPMAHESGEWKVGALDGSALVLGAGSF